MKMNAQFYHEVFLSEPTEVPQDCNLFLKLDAQRYASELEFAKKLFEIIYENSREKLETILAKIRQIELPEKKKPMRRVRRIYLENAKAIQDCINTVIDNFIERANTPAGQKISNLLQTIAESVEYLSTCSLLNKMQNPYYHAYFIQEFPSFLRRKLILKPQTKESFTQELENEFRRMIFLFKVNATKSEEKECQNLTNVQEAILKQLAIYIEQLTKLSQKIQSPNTLH